MIEKEQKVSQFQKKFKGKSCFGMIEKEEKSFSIPKKLFQAINKVIPQKER
jgi:hypothetical protein